MIFELIVSQTDKYDIIKSIVALEKEIFGKSAYTFESIEGMLEKNKQYRIFYAKNDNKVIGYLITLDCIDSFEILKIATSTNYRKSNIGTKLIEQIKTKDIFLEVRESNFTAINFYLKNNFKNIGKRKNYYADNNENANTLKLEVDNE